MPQSWIKIEHPTPDKPELDIMSEQLDLDIDAVLGKCVRLWVWADQQIRKCNAPSVTKKTIDRVARCDGFADALVEVDWLRFYDGGVEFVNADRHISKTAKDRALTNARVSEHRGKKKRIGNGDSVTDALPEKRRVEKRREEEEEEQNTSSSGDDGEHKSTSSSAKARFSAEQVEGIYLAYPRRVGPRAAKAKIKIALREISKRKGMTDPLGWLMGRVQAYAEVRNGCNKRWTPHPTTWFNEGRYDDDPSEWLKDERKTDGKQQQRFSEGEW